MTAPDVSPEVRRSRHLSAHWGVHGLEFTVLATGRSVLVQPRHVGLLSACGQWTTLEALTAELRGAGGAEVQDDIAWLLERGLLVSRTDEDDPEAALRAERERLIDDWDRWAGATAAFHLGTKDVPYVDPLERKERLVRRRRMPGPTKSFPDVEPVELPAFARRGALPDVLRARRTWRCFEPNARVDRDQLSSLLGLTWAVQGWAIFPDVPPQALKTSPSGGARHSIEAYALVLDVEDVAPGLYHYAPDLHALHPLDAEMGRQDVARFLPGQPAYLDASVVVFQTSIFERVRWRYPHPRSYRNVFIESGHLAQTFCLVATDLGLAPFCTAALSDAAVEDALGIDGISESLIYAVGVGTRPDVAWAPVPFHQIEGRVMPPTYADRFGSIG